MVKCWKCGKELGTIDIGGICLGTIDIGGICQTCQNSMSLPQPPLAVVYFGYECPDCHGRFNNPVVKCLKSVCPFCGRHMKGVA